VEPIDGISKNAEQQEAVPVSRQREVAREHQRVSNQSSASGYPDVHYPSSSSKGELSGLDILTQAATQSMYELHDYSDVYNNGSVVHAPYNPEIGTGKRVPYKSQNAVAKQWQMQKTASASKAYNANVNRIPGSFANTRRVSCDACGNAKKKCNREEVCQNCIKWGTQCVYSIRKNPGASHAGYRPKQRQPLPVANMDRKVIYQPDPMRLPVPMDSKVIYRPEYAANMYQSSDGMNGGQWADNSSRSIAR